MSNNLQVLNKIAIFMIKYKKIQNKGVKFFRYNIFCLWIGPPGRDGFPGEKGDRGDSGLPVSYNL